jgi:2-polyprenyl-3-methyl-5-hydroxy-6-metoxy-1,4-benzoquinol methylase
MNTHLKSECSDKITPYYNHFRGSILEYVPKSAECVLSVGCADGITEAELVKEGIKVVGVELNHESAIAARQKGLIVLEGDATDIDVTEVSDCYDCLIYADILEHLSDPLSVLKRHIAALNSNGIVIVSVPNFRHYSVFWQLFVRGQVEYEDAGILDHTHLRITTRKTVLRWFEETGLEPIKCKSIICRRRDRLISACFLGLARDFIGQQILVVGKKI